MIADYKLDNSTIEIPTNGAKRVDKSYEELELQRRKHWELISNIRQNTMYNELRQKETNLVKHNERLELLKELDEIIPIEQSKVENMATELMQLENAEELYLQFNKFKEQCEEILQKKSNVIKEFQKELDNKNNLYIHSIQKFKTDITYTIELMRKQFISIRNEMLNHIWHKDNETDIIKNNIIEENNLSTIIPNNNTDKQTSDNLNKIENNNNSNEIIKENDIDNEVENKQENFNSVSNLIVKEEDKLTKAVNCIEGEFLRDRELLLKDYSHKIKKLLDGLQFAEEDSGNKLSQAETDKEKENEKEAFKEETRFINRVLVMEKIFNILKEQTEDFSYELKTLLETLEYRVEIREEKIKENKEKKKEFINKKNKIRVKISKSQKDYKNYDDQLKSENKSLKIDFIKTTDSFDDLKKKFKHFKSYDEERFMKIYNMKITESIELAKKVLLADRTIKSQQLGADYILNKNNNNNINNEKIAFTLEELQNSNFLENESAILVEKNNKEIKDNNKDNKINLLSNINIDKVKEIFSLIIQEAEFLIDMKTLEEHENKNFEDKFPYYFESICKALLIKNESELKQLIALFNKKSIEKSSIEDNLKENNNDLNSNISNNTDSYELNIDSDNVLDILKEFSEERKKLNKNEDKSK